MRSGMRKGLWLCANGEIWDAQHIEITIYQVMKFNLYHVE